MADDPVSDIKVHSGDECWGNEFSQHGVVPHRYKCLHVGSREAALLSCLYVMQGERHFALRDSEYGLSVPASDRRVAGREEQPLE